MSKGKVKTYDPNRGYGVIIDADTGKQLTVYANYIKLLNGETLHEGQPVEFEVENNNHQHWAINVRSAK